ncbi:MAG: UDP-N-acetylmuramate dehydrogenase [Balneolaceae bacterium]|nr:UDP-N-acetylmuramate dehydrogenase [Balneolaceae bacterium]
MPWSQSSLMALVAKLSKLCPGNVQIDVPLAELSRWKIGGTADVIVEPSSVAQLVSLRKFIFEEGLPSVVVGDTSNLLFSDSGLRCICIRLGSRLSKVDINDSEVTAESGIWVPFLARILMKEKLTGAEHICGIPGTLGGLICMNGGSQRKGIGSAVVEVTSIDQRGELVKFDRDSCEFSYRTSIFQNNNTVIVSSKMRFQKVTNQRKIRQEMLAILRERRKKFPRKQPNCGSVFKSDPKMYPAFGPPGLVIERLGYKGYKIGDAQVSPNHANFFVNNGTATAANMVELIVEVQDAVFNATGYRLVPEVRFVEPDGEVVSISDKGERFEK